MSKGDTTRDRILGEAIALASRDGLTGLTLGRLADDVGMSKSGLFAHFRSKEELQLQVLDAAIARFQALVIAPSFRAPRGEARIRVLFDRWLAWLDDPEMPGGCIFVQASVELDDQPGAPRDRVAAAQRQWLDHLAGAARLAMEVGDFRPDLDADLFAFQLQGIVLSRQHAARLLGDPAADDRVRRAFDALLASSRS